MVNDNWYNFECIIGLIKFIGVMAVRIVHSIHVRGELGYNDEVSIFRHLSEGKKYKSEKAIILLRKKSYTRTKD